MYRSFSSNCIKASSQKECKEEKGYRIVGNASRNGEVRLCIKKEFVHAQHLYRQIISCPTILAVSQKRYFRILIPNSEDEAILFRTNGKVALD